MKTKQSALIWCRKYPNLQGRDQEIARLTEGNYQNILTRHADKVVDDRAQTHLQACTDLLAKYDAQTGLP